METEFTDLSEPAFLLINVPLALLNLAANVFYVCCLVFPSKGRKLRQPLKVLLGYLVWCSIVYFVSLAGIYGVLKGCKNAEAFLVSWMLFMRYVHNSVTCSVWLNFYYYVHIVPLQRALLIWVKRNIKQFIYAVVLLDCMFFFILGVLTVVNAVIQVSSESAHINGTWTEHHKDGKYFAAQIGVFIIKAPVFSCMCCIMTFSCFSTAHYLHGHIRSVARDGLSSTPRLQSQIRVAITGISQGVLCSLYATFYFFDSFATMISLRDLSAWVSFTVTSLYLSGTTVNLGIGQAVFRRRAAHACRALRARCGVVGMATNDVEIHSIHLA